MTRTMYDGIDAARLPVTAQLVGGYVDGNYRWSATDWARFPHAVKVRIAVFGDTDDGHVLDVEPGNATPAQSVDWVLMRRRAGADPTVYMNATTWPVVRSAFMARGVAEPHYWVAQYDGVAAIPAGAVGKQHTNDQAAGWDLSSVADYWPGVDPAPVPAPVPHPLEDEMSTTSIGGRAGLSWAAGSRHVVQVTYDPGGGDPKLRVVLDLVSGPLVASDDLPSKVWALAGGSGVLEIPAVHIAACRGVVLEGAPGLVYDATAV
ncbi:MAG: hypothetical protein ACRDRN_11830 [Sciscionella sp.]